MLQKGFVARNPINHAMTMPVPAPSAGCGVGPWNYQSHWCPSTSSEDKGLFHLGVGKRKQVESNRLYFRKAPILVTPARTVLWST